MKTSATLRPWSEWAAAPPATMRMKVSGRNGVGGGAAQAFAGVLALDAAFGQRQAAGSHAAVFTAGALAADVTGFHGDGPVEHRIDAQLLRPFEHFLGRGIDGWLSPDPGVRVFSASTCAARSRRVSARSLARRARSSSISASILAAAAAFSLGFFFRLGFGFRFGLGFGFGFRLGLGGIGFRLGFALRPRLWPWLPLRLGFGSGFSGCVHLGRFGYRFRLWRLALGASVGRRRGWRGCRLGRRFLGGAGAFFAAGAAFFLFRDRQIRRGANAARSMLTSSSVF
jgi:hypothetical protein